MRIPYSIDEREPLSILGAEADAPRRAKSANRRFLRGATPFAVKTSMELFPVEMTSAHY